MNPGPVEEVGKATGMFMQVMKDQPLSLALCLMNVLLLALFFYVAKVATENRRHEFEQVLASQAEVNKLLYNCVPHSRTDLVVPLPIPRPEGIE